MEWAGRAGSQAPLPSPQQQQQQQKTAAAAAQANDNGYMMQHHLTLLQHLLTMMQYNTYNMHAAAQMGKWNNKNCEKEYGCNRGCANEKLLTCCAQSPLRDRWGNG